MFDDAANISNNSWIYTLACRQHDDASGNALRFGQDKAGIRLQGAIGFHTVAAGPEVFPGYDVLRV